MKISTDYLLGISEIYKRKAEQGELSLRSDDSLISLEEIQFTLEVLLDLRVGRIVLTTDRFKEYLDDMIDICVNAYRHGLSQETGSSMVKEKYNIGIVLTSNEKERYQTVNY